MLTLTSKSVAPIYFFVVHKTVSYKKCWLLSKFLQGAPNSQCLKVKMELSWSVFNFIFILFFFYLEKAKG